MTKGFAAPNHPWRKSWKTRNPSEALLAAMKCIVMEVRNPSAGASSNTDTALQAVEDALRRDDSQN